MGGGKKQSGQRTKGNVKPSSSSRAADLLNQDGRREFIGFGGLTSAVGNSLGYVPLSSTSPSTSSGDVEYDVDSDLRMLLRKMTKKDMTTKLKAIQEFKDVAEKKDADALVKSIVFWPKIYNSLSKDYDQRVRESIQFAHSTLVQKIERNLATILKLIAGQWLLSQFDASISVSNEARKSFNICFPSAKKANAIKFCKKEIFQVIKENLCLLTVENIADAKIFPIEERDGQFQNTISSSCKALSYFIQTIDAETNKNYMTDYQSIFDNKSFWKHAKSTSPLIRCSFYLLLSTVIDCLHEIRDTHKQQISKLCFNAIDDDDANTVYYTWECALKITTLIKDWSELVSIPKLVIPKLKTVLRHCCYGNAAIIMPNVLPLIGQLCNPVVKSVPDKMALFEILSNDFSDCLFPEKSVQSENDQSSIVRIYTEFLHFILAFKGNDGDLPLNAMKIADLVLQHVIKIFENLLKRSQEKVIEEYYKALFLLLKFCDTHLELENILYFSNCFWKEIKESILKKLHSQEDGKSYNLLSCFLNHCCNVLVLNSWNTSPKSEDDTIEIELSAIQSQLLGDLIRCSSVVCLKNSFNKSAKHAEIVSKILRINCNNGIVESLIRAGKEPDFENNIELEEKSPELNGKDFNIYVVGPLLKLSCDMKEEKCPTYDTFLEYVIDIIVTVLHGRTDINTSDLNSIISQMKGLDEIYWLTRKVSLLDSPKRFLDVLRKEESTRAIITAFQTVFESKESKHLDRCWELASIIFECSDKNDFLVSSSCLNEFIHLTKSQSLFLDISIYRPADSFKFLDLCSAVFPHLPTECISVSQELLVALVTLLIDHCHDDIQKACTRAITESLNRFLILDQADSFLQKLSKGLTTRCLVTSASRVSVTTASTVLNTVLIALSQLKESKYLSQFIDSVLPNPNEMLSSLNSLSINNNWLEIGVIEGSFTCCVEFPNKSNSIKVDQMEKAVKTSEFVIPLLDAMLKIKTDEMSEILSRKNLLRSVVHCISVLDICQCSIGLKNEKSYLVCAKENNVDLCKRLNDLGLMLKRCIQDCQVPLSSLLDISVNSYSNSNPVLGASVFQVILGNGKERKETEQQIESSVANVTGSCPCDSQAMSSEIKAALKECCSPSVARLAIECLRENVFGGSCENSTQHVTVILDLFVTALQSWYFLFETNKGGPDDLSLTLISFLEQIVSWKEATNGSLMLTTSTLNDSTNLAISFNASLMVFIGLVVNRCADKITSPLWDFILCTAAGWLNTCEETTADNTSIYQSLFISESCSLFDSISCFFSSLEENPSDGSNSIGIASNKCIPSHNIKAHNLPDNLVTEWNEFFQPAMESSLYQIFVKFCIEKAIPFIENANSISNINVTRSISRSLLSIPEKRLKPLIITQTTDGETGLDKSNPVLKAQVNELFGRVCPLLSSKNHALQLTSYHVLSSVSDQVELQEVKQEDGLVAQLLPAEILKRLQETTEVAHKFIDTLQLNFGDPLPKELPHSTVSQILSHLLTWQLALRIFNGADSNERVSLASHLEKDCNIVKTLSYLFNILSKFKDYRSAVIVPDYEMSVNDLQAIGAYVYAMALSCVPAVVRGWLSGGLDRRSAAIVDSYTCSQISPVLWKREIGALKGSSKHFNNMTIRSRAAVGEVIATYTLDEMSVELVVKMARNHPLGQVTVDSGKRLGVSNALWRQWMLQLVTFLSYQNGSIFDGLALWKRNVDKKFDGVEECTVCFSVIHGSNYTLPTMRCRTCKKKFHPVCLYKWFNTSNRSTCPLCRNDFY